MTDPEPTTPDEPKRRDFRWLIPVVIACVLGVINSFRPTLTSAFTQMQADPIDSRFNNYILEHTHRCITPGPYVGTLWSPAFFYPAKNVLAYSDNLLGSAPIYWLFRLVAAPSVAFSLWMIGCSILCFAAFAVLGRRLKLHPFLIAAGAMIFAFGVHRSRLINHQQMLPQFFYPLAVWAAWEWTRRPTIAKFALLLGGVFLQLLCGIYLGWFLALSLVIFIPLLFIQSDVRRGCWQFTLQQWLPVCAIIAIFVATSLVVFHPYILQQRTSSGYSWNDVQAFLPSSRSFGPPWTFRPRDGSTFSQEVKPALPLGGFVFLIALFSVSLRLKRVNSSGDVRMPLGAAAFATGILLIVLSSRSTQGFSPWIAIYKFVPGARAIRAVSRIDVVVFFFLTLAVVIGLDLIISRISQPMRRNALAVAIAIVLCAEQWVTGLPSFDINAWQNDVQEQADLMSAGGDIAYVQNYTAKNPQQFSAMEITAMWAGLQANKPVVNGYSGNWPRGYDIHALMFPPGMIQWLSSAQPPPRTLIIIAPNDRGMPPQWPSALPQEATWTTNHFVGGTFRLK
jgi:hypothetical protein